MDFAFRYVSLAILPIVVIYLCRHGHEILNHNFAEPDPQCRQAQSAVFSISAIEMFDGHKKMKRVVARTIVSAEQDRFNKVVSQHSGTHFLLTLSSFLCSSSFFSFDACGSIVMMD